MIHAVITAEEMNELFAIDHDVFSFEEPVYADDYDCTIVYLGGGVWHIDVEDAKVCADVTFSQIEGIMDNAAPNLKQSILL